MCFTWTDAVWHNNAALKISLCLTEFIQLCKYYDFYLQDTVGTYGIFIYVCERVQRAHASLKLHSVKERELFVPALFKGWHVAAAL